MRRAVPDQAGFTLIELVAAMSIFAIVAVIAQQSMFNAMAQSSRLSKGAADLAELELAVSLVTRDLENIAPRPIRTGESQIEPALILTGNGAHLTFTRGGVVDPIDRARSPFLRVAYNAAEVSETLQRRLWTRLDRPALATPRDALLWSGIKAARFRVFANGQWQDSWPPREEDDPAVLPEGVAVTFETQRWGPIERVVALR